MRIIQCVFLSKWFFIIYFLLGLIYFFAFPSFVTGISCEKSIFVTLALMTGSDPFTFKDTIESHIVIWILSWLIHIASWLFIPALIGIVVNEAAKKILSVINAGK